MKTNYNLINNISINYIKQLIEDCIPDFIFLTNIFSVFKLNKNNLNDKMNEILQIDKDVIKIDSEEFPNLKISPDKMKKVYLDYLYSFQDKTNFNIVKKFFVSNLDFLIINDKKFNNGAAGEFFVDRNGNLRIKVTENNSCRMLYTFVHEMQHLLNYLKYSYKYNQDFDELSSIIHELYFCDFLEEKISADYNQIIKYDALVQMIFVIYDIINSFIELLPIMEFYFDCNNSIEKNKFIGRIIDQYGMEKLKEIFDDISFATQFFNEIVALDIYFNNRDKENGIEIVKQYMKLKHYKQINFPSFMEILKETFDEIENLKSKILLTNKFIRQR